MFRVLYVEDDAQLGAAIASLLRRHGHAVDHVLSVELAFHALECVDYDVVLSDQQMPEARGVDLLREMRMQRIMIPVIFLTAYGTIDDAVESVQSGALHYLRKPVNPDVLLRVIADAGELSRSDRDLTLRVQQEASGGSGFRLIGESRAMRTLMERVVSAASTNVSVLVAGETGTGKELVARAIHSLSARRDGPFVAVNCSAMPDSLIESTLFGHEKGAFTGAVARTLGVFQRAAHGTLLLDEVSEMRPDLQTKLLRVLQERSFERVGGKESIDMNARVIATMNRVPSEAIASGAIRADLFYRLNGFSVTTPPLRARQGDITLLARHFIAKASVDLGKPVHSVSSAALAGLNNYQWPGNVRQLKAVVEAAVALCSDGVLNPTHFELPDVDGADGAHAAPVASTARAKEATALHDLDIDRMEAHLIRQALLRTGNRYESAARLLGINVRTLRRKLRRAASDPPLD